MTQHPSLLNSLTFTPAFAAADVHPERKLCNENSSLSMTTAVTTARKLYMTVEHFSFSVSCGDVKISL